MTASENPGELFIQVEFNGDKKKIKRLEPHVASKALGVYLAPDGKYNKQFEILDKKIRKWARKIRTSSLSHRERLVAYHGYILRGILYVLSATSFTKEQCDKLQTIISPILYNAFRVQRNASRIPLYTPKSLGGYGIVSIYHLQGIEKLKYLFMHRRRSDTTGELLNISMRYTQLELGISKTFWSTNYNKYHHFITETWTTDIWRYTHSCGVKIIDNAFWNYKLPRRHDFFLMDAVINTGLSLETKQIFNQIRMYMKIISAADLFFPNTNTFKPDILDCAAPLSSSLGFPNIKPFPQSWKKAWRSILLTIILPRVRSLPLGDNINPSHLDEHFSTHTTDTSTAEHSTIDFSNGIPAITSPQFHEGVKCIHNCIKRSDKWLRHIWGPSRLSHRNLFTILTLAKREHLVLATDASIDEGCGAHAFCFADGRKGKTLFTSGSKVEGPKAFLTSYRAEMVAIIASISLIDTIMSAVGLRSTRISLFSDSETSIITSRNHKLNTLHYALSNDIDVALQLYSTVKECQQTIMLSHVQGHQDENRPFNDLPIPSQLNILMDSLSKKIVRDTTHDPNNIIPFPAQQMYLSTSHPISHDIQNILITNEMNKAIAKYYEKHHEIPQNCLQDIDWDANKLALSTTHETSYRKTFHHLRNTMTINKKWKKSESDLCPLCSAAPEDIHHLMSCRRFEKI